MEKEFIPYEQALALKELGFDENCFGFFWVTENHTSFLHIEFMIGKMNRLNKLNILRPTFSQAFRWFRTTYRLHSDVYVGIKGFWFRIYEFIDCTEYDLLFEVNNLTNYSPLYFETYEEAELECLKKLIEIVKNK